MQIYLYLSLISFKHINIILGKIFLQSLILIKNRKIEITVIVPGLQIQSFFSLNMNSDSVYLFIVLYIKVKLKLSGFNFLNYQSPLPRNEELYIWFIFF